MEAAPVSIFDLLYPQEILDRLAGIKVEAEIGGAAIPEGTVHALFAVLERRIPEVGPAIEEIPEGAPLSPDFIEDVLTAAEDAMDARSAYLAAA